MPDGPRRVLQLCPFTQEETDTFVRHFFRVAPARGQRMCDELRHKMAVSGMAQNPLLATLLCLAFSPSPNREPLSFPVCRVEVCDRVLAGLLGEWERTKVDQMEASPSPGVIAGKRRLLEELAYHIFPDEELTAEAFYDFFWEGKDSYMGQLPANHPLQVHLRQKGTTLEEVLLQDGILVPCGGIESYMFLHLTFEEYLTSCALARRLELQSSIVTNYADENQFRSGRPLSPIWQKVDSCAWLPEWHEVLILLAGNLKNPQPLLELLADMHEQNDDYFRHRLALAAECLPEIPEALHQSALHAHVGWITTDAFRLWWGYDQDGITAVVSHLTRALPALGQVNGPLLDNEHDDITPSHPMHLSLLDWIEVQLTSPS